MICPDEAIAKMPAGYAAAVAAKDVDAFAGLYADDVRIFDMWGRWSHDLDAWRRSAADWFGSLGTERVNVSFAEVESTGSGDLAVLHAIVTYAGLAADGSPLRAMQNRLTWAMRRSGDVWKIVHEHTSAPIDFETSKPILRR